MKLLIFYGLAVELALVTFFASSLRMIIPILALAQLLHVVVALRLLPKIDSRSTSAGIITFGILFRLTLIPADPIFSDDVYRNLWDGRVQRAGFSVYEHSPNAPEVAELRDEIIWPRINHKEYRTIYPPLAQLAARPCHSLLQWKLLILVVELAGASLLGWALYRQKRFNAFFIYACSPLLAVEFYGSGHVDALGVGLLAAATGLLLHRPSLLAGFMLAGSTFVKLLSAPVLVLAVIAYQRMRFILGAALAFIIILGLHGSDSFGFLASLREYQGNWSFNGVVHRILHVDYWFSLPHEGSSGQKALARTIVSAAIVLGGAIAIRRGANFFRAATWTFGLFLLFQPTIHPWYLTWLLPLLCVEPVTAFLFWPVSAMLSYHVLTGENGWQENLLFQAIIILPVFGLIIRDLWRTLAPRS